MRWRWEGYEVEVGGVMRWRWEGYEVEVGGVMRHHSPVTTLARLVVVTTGRLRI